MMSNHDRAGKGTKDKEYLARIGDNIRKARKQKGYSQEAFADIAGFSRSYVTEIETGKRNISVLNLIKIINVLKIDANEIIGSIKPK